MSIDDPAAQVTNTSGIVNVNSPVSGAQAAGENNTVTQTIAPASPESVPHEVTAADLLEAIRAVRRDFERHRTEQPGAVPHADADDADEALRKVEDEAAKPQPEPRVIRRRIAAIVDSLSAVATVAASGSGLAASATTLVGSVARLQAVFLKLFGG